MKRGLSYEIYVNKFLKGNLVSSKIDCYDIETKKALYEVKGANIYIEKRNGLTYAHYRICPKNHALFKTEADKLSKKAKYIFVLKVSNSKIFKMCSWEMVTMAMKTGKKYFHNDYNKELIYIHFKEIW